MTVYRAVVKRPAEWRYLLRHDDAVQPLKPRGYDCERRRLHGLIATGELLGVPVGRIVETDQEDEEDARTRECARPRCSETFAVSTRYPDRKYCSVRCAGRTRYGTDDRDRRKLCPECGLWFIAMVVSQKTCGPVCGQRAGQRTRRAREEATRA